MTTDVLTFTPEDGVVEASRALVEAGIDGAPVVDVDGQVVGLLSVSDLLVQEAELHPPRALWLLDVFELPGSARRFEEEVRRASAAFVVDVMTSEPITIGPDETLERAATLMHDNKVGRLPVVEDGRLVGIVGATDILRAVVESGP